MKIISIEEIEKRIKNQFVNQPFQIIEYTKVTSPITIKCLHCGETKTYFSANNFLKKDRKNICSCYNIDYNLTKHYNNQKIIKQLCLENNLIKFISFDYREKTKKHTVNVFCKECKQIFNKDYESFIKNQNCPFCFSKHNLNTLGFSAILPEEYELISNYKDTETKVLIRHNCGFIWKIKPHNFISKINSGYIGCPQCNHKHSQGELKIVKWLKENKIIFIQEQIFYWSSNSKFRYDFYLPDYNLIIEYMGQQHYKEVEFFHDTLEQRQQYDKIKEEEAKNQNFNYLIIPYYDFNNIEIILQDWFNDYSLGKQIISD